jgi:hypothetical protein
MAAAAAALTAEDAEHAVARMFGDSPTDPTSGLFGGKEDTVKVAARIRPMSAAEIRTDPRQAVSQTGTAGISCTVRNIETGNRCSLVVTIQNPPRALMEIAPGLAPLKKDVSNLSAAGSGVFVRLD